MTTELKKSALYSENPRFTQGKEIVNREYAKATVDSHRGLSGVVIPSALSTDANSVGAQFEIHPVEPLPFNATIQGPDGNEQTIHVNVRAHKLLRKHNRNGEVKLGFAEAVKMAAEEEILEKQGITLETTAVEEVPPLPETIGTDPVPLGETAGAIGPVGSPGLVGESLVSAKRGRKPKQAEPAQKPMPVKVTTVTVEGPAGSMVLTARDIFIGGPSGMLLVMVQDQRFGTVYLPPVKTEDPDEFTISFNGEVYKAIPALYYQLPGTAIYHAVYLVV